MRIKQISIFKRRVKKMHSAEKESLDQAIKNIISNPSIREMKRGDLLDIQIQKHKHNILLLINILIASCYSPSLSMAFMRIFIGILSYID